jgi:hypothetical protein
LEITTIDRNSGSSTMNAMSDAVRAVSGTFVM